MELSMELSAEFIRPMEERNSVPGIGAAENKNVFGEKKSLFQNILENAVEQVRITQEDAENKKYLWPQGSWTMLILCLLLRQKQHLALRCWLL